MIDIHAHILPGIDDGADSLDMTLEMLALAAESGVTDIVATPHCNIPGVYENYVNDALRQLSRQVLEEKERAGISIRLHRGMELFATEELPELLEQRRVWTIGGSSYFLMEFSFFESPDFCNDILSACVKKGFRPIIAHPERYEFLQEDPQLAFEWCTRGYGLQINKGSLLGRFGGRVQELARSLLTHGLGACVASDAHNLAGRSPYMREVRRLLRLEYGESYADMLLEENPYRILRGRPLLGYEPIPF